MSLLPLVIYHKQLGDLLLLEPALAKLSAASNGPVRLSTRSGFLPMVSLMENVIGESGVRVSGASEVIAFSGNFHATLKAFITFSSKKSLWVKNPLHLKPWHRLIYSGGGEYVPTENLYRARYYYKVMPCSENVAFRPPKLRPPPDAWRHPNLPPDYVLLHPTSAWPKKSWPARNWSKVLDGLQERGMGPFVVTGGSASWEMEFAQTVCSNTSATTLNLAGRTSLKQYLHTVANARLVLCIDGSSSHLAPAFGRPSLALFGETSPLVWHLETDLARALLFKNGADGEETCGITSEQVVKSVLLGV